MLSKDDFTEAERRHHQLVKEVIAELAERATRDGDDTTYMGVPRGVVLVEACERGLPPPQADDALEDLLMRGEVYEPTNEHYRVV